MKNGFGLGGASIIAVRLSDVIDDVGRRIAGEWELDASDDPADERLSLPRFETWNTRDGAGDAIFEYWPIPEFCDEKGP